MSDHRYLTTKKATLIAIVLNTFLGLFKVLFGFIGHSQGLIADGIHSFSDLLTDITVILSAKFGSEKPDLEHPYGHGRIETLGTFIIAIVVIIVGLGIAFDGVHQMLSEKPQRLPDMSVLIVAIFSILIKEWLYRYTLKKAKPIYSDLLRSNAWHHRSDALSSLIVLIGAGGSMAGIRHLDSMAAVLVSLLIIKMGISMIWNSLSELIDTGADPDTLTSINKIISEIDGIQSLHQLRTRLMGGTLLIDVHVLVSPYITVSEGHYISEQVEIALRKKFSHIHDVIVHIDPENDEKCALSNQLPKRQHIEAQIKKQTNKLPYFDAIQKINLHYLEGQLSVELFMSLNKVGSSELDLLSKRYRLAILQIKTVKSVSLCFF